MQQVASEVIDTVFVPRIIAKQLALAIALETGVVRNVSILGRYFNRFFDSS